MKLNTLDLTVFPAAMCRGRKPKEQAIIAWLWAFEVAGKKWTMAELSECVGVAVNRKELEALAQTEPAPILFAQEGSRPYEQWFVNNQYCGTVKQVVKVKEKEKKKVEYPTWVWGFHRAYKETLGGYTLPSDILANLSQPVKDHGEAAVAKAFAEYTEDVRDPKFASWKNFARNIGKYLDTNQPAPHYTPGM